MKILVIPDVHLKPEMFDRAAKIMRTGNFDNSLFLGDLVDDWGWENNLQLYEKTFDALEAYMTEFPDALYCYGNHDLSYILGRMESGYSYSCAIYNRERFEKIVKMMEDRLAVVHLIDETVFCHGGIMYDFIDTYLSDLPDKRDTVFAINDLRLALMWDNDSPVWARPQYEPGEAWDGYYQVVGHTPVSKPLRQNKILTLDTFSTNPDGTPIGPWTFIVVDTVTGKAWECSDNGILGKEV